MDVFINIWSVVLDTAFWLLLGLFAAGLIKAYIPADAMQRWVGGSGFSAITRAALFGAPLPLCSCGVLPAAIGLRRSGASKEATVSFLISTPETSIDSVAVTYALMGPLMAVYRPLAALVSAIVTGMMVTIIERDVEEQTASSVEAQEPTSCCSEKKVVETASCCAAQEKVEEASCCSSDNEGVVNEEMVNTETVAASKMSQAIKYAAAELMDDISRWMAFGIVVAGVMLTFIPPDMLAQWGQGPLAMLLMLVVGVPMYICAVASTPVAAGLLLAGVSPGAVLVFLLVGPATNIAGLILVGKELGRRVMVTYLAGIATVSVAMGIALEWLIEQTNWVIEAELGMAHSMLPSWLAWGSALLLVVLAVPRLRRALFPVLA